MTIIVIRVSKKKIIVSGETPLYLVHIRDQDSVFISDKAMFEWGVRFIDRRDKHKVPLDVIQEKGLRVKAPVIPFKTPMMPIRRRKK
jgi:hypothetical protein